MGMLFNLTMAFVEHKVHCKNMVHTDSGKYHGNGTPYSPGKTPSTYHVITRYTPLEPINISMASSNEKLSSIVAGLEKLSHCAP